MHTSIITRRHLLMGAAALAAPAILSACGQGVPVDEQGRIRVRLAMPGPARAEHGGFYQAIASGAYAKRNLNVQIIHGNTAEDVSRNLASGNAELGLAQDSFAALRMVADNAPVKAVAAFFQKDPRVLIGHASGGPRTLTEIGQRQLFIEDANWPDIWHWLRTRYNLGNEQIQRPESGALTPFIENDDSLLIGSLTREPAMVSAVAPELQTRLLLPADDGYASYSNLLLTPNGFARDNAEALRGFISATVEGWNDYMNGDAEKAHNLIRRANPATPQGSLTEARDLLKVHSIVEGGDAALLGLGTMTEERWQAFAEQSSGAFGAEPDWKAAFTTQFLPTRS